MRYDWFKNSGPAVKFILALSLMLTFGTIIYFVAVLIAAPLFNVSTYSILNVNLDAISPSHIKIFQFLQVVQSFALFIIPSILLAILFSERPLDYLSARNKSKAYLYILAVCLILVMIPLINYLQNLNSGLKLPSQLKGIEDWMKNSEEDAARLSESFLKVNTTPALFFNLFMMAILPAIGEEFIFRGIFQKIFSELFKNVHIGILVSAAFFSAIHFQFYGFVPRMLLGLIFGYLLIWSGSIWIPVLAHFFNNCMGVLYYYFLNKGMVSNSLDSLGTKDNDYPMVLVSLILSALILMVFYNYSRKKQEQETY